MDRKEVMVALGKQHDSTQVLRRYEMGRRPSRENLLSTFIRGLHETKPRTINRGLKLAGYELLSADELIRFGLSHTGRRAEPERQKVRWGPVDARPAGITIVSPQEGFIPWKDLRTEIKQKLLNQLGMHVPPECDVALNEFHGRKDWIVSILDASSKRIGDVWFGPDPEKGWEFDGLVRVGNTEVWQVFERFSDGSYRRIRAKSS